MDPLAAELITTCGGGGLTLATAESLTGGRVAAAIAGTPGASAVYRGGVVAYATDVKTSLLGVPEQIVETHGVVSAQCAEAMAAGVRDLLGVDVALATTGVAGPDRQEGRPVGTVFVGLAIGSRVTSRELALSGDRSAIVDATVAAALADALHALGRRADLPREEPGVG